MTVTRVYNNGDRLSKELSPREGEAEIAYNSDFRPGCAVFRDDVGVQMGYLTRERCDVISADLRRTTVRPPVTDEMLRAALFLRDGWGRLHVKVPRKSPLQTYEEKLWRRFQIANRRLLPLLTDVTKGPHT